MKKFLAPFIAGSLIALAGCDQSPAPKQQTTAVEQTIKLQQPTERKWWHDAVVYEIWPRSFYDTDNDGHGDFNGITAKLDYLTDLGANTIWLTPIFEAPSYHGYDYQDFYSVESDYGSMEDFDNLIKQSHEKGIKIVLDLVINHISDQHPWFIKSANKEPGYEDYFIWSKELPEGYGKAWGDEVNSEAVWFWHEGRQEYYYAAFASTQPDVNLKHPQVVQAMKDMATFWLNKGVDGFRLDAVRYVVEDGGVGFQSDRPGTFEYWRDFSAHVKSLNPEAMLVGEAWAPMDKVALYYDQGKGLEAAFDFDFGYVVAEAAKAEKHDKVGVFGETGAAKSIGRAALWDNLKARHNSGAPEYFYSPFLSNHDQSRIMFNLENHPIRARISAALVLTSPGAPYLYYGEEIGVTQSLDNGEDVYQRAIMQWNETANAGFNNGDKLWLDEAKWTPWNPNFKPWWQDYWLNKANASTSNVASQLANDGSLFKLYQKLIELKQSDAVIRYPEQISLLPSNNHIWFVRYQSGTENRFIAINLDAESAHELEVASSLQGQYTDLLTGQSKQLTATSTLESGQILILK